MPNLPKWRANRQVEGASGVTERFTSFWFSLRRKGLHAVELRFDGYRSQMGRTVKRRNETSVDAIAAASTAANSRRRARRNDRCQNRQ
jgi:hypothetical protein